MIIPESDIENNIKCMISFFIMRKKKKDNVLYKLSYCYITSEKKFGICLEKKSTKKEEIIERYNDYHGNEESIYLLTKVLLRNDIKQKIFN